MRHPGIIPKSHRRSPWRVAAIVLFAVMLLYLSRRTGLFGVLLFLPLSAAGAVLAWITAGVRRLGAGRRRRATRVLAALVAGALGVGNAFLLLYGTLSIVRFAGDRGALPLQDRYVVVVVADGASLLHARRLLYSGLKDPAQYATQISRSLPNISRYFLREGAFTASGISVWPSSSVPAHTSIVTGCYPRRTHVMGMRQFEPQRRRHTSFIGPGILAIRSLLPRQVKTINEYFPDVRSLSVLQFANRGCSLYLPLPPSDEVGVRRLKQTVGLTHLAGRLTRKSEIPRVVVITLPDIDHVTHNARLDDARSIRLYLKADECLGEIIRLYQRIGIYDKTLFVLCADHAMGEVHNHVTIDNLMRDMRFHTFEALKWSLVPAWGSFESNLFVGSKRKFDRVHDALALWGGNSDALLYVKGQSRDAAGRVTAAGWQIPVTEAALHNYHVGGTDINVIERLLAYSPGIGLVLANPRPGVFDVHSRAGRGRIEERRKDGETQFRYTIVAREDPLGYWKNPRIRPFIEKGAWLSDGRWMQLTYLEHYPDAVRRIASTFGNERAGTLDVVAADGWDFAPYYVAEEVLVGSHGSLNQQQSTVPIMFHGPGIKRTELAYGRTVDVIPTILAYLGVSDFDTDGRPLPVFADEARNREIARMPGNTFIAGRVRAGAYSYTLETPYALYDRQIVRTHRRTHQREILVPSIRAALPALSREPNVTLDLEGFRHPDLEFRILHVGEASTGSTLCYDVVKREFHQ